MSVAARARGDSRACSGTLLSQPLEAIEALRAAAAIPLLEFCRHAAVSDRGYRHYLRGERKPSRPVLQRLETALERLLAAQAHGSEVDARQALLMEAALGGFRAQAQIVLAPFAGDDAARARLVRDAAIYGVNQMAGVRQADLARHVKLTRARICQTIRAIEDRRDRSPVFDAAMAALLRGITGEEG